MKLQPTIIKHRQGDKCPVCYSTDVKREKGILITKRGQYGFFLSCSLYPDCQYACKATQSDKRKFKGKKTRRGKRKTKATDHNWKKKVERAMRQHQKMKREMDSGFQMQITKD